MKLTDRAQFQIELEDLAKRYSLRLKETPSMTYGPGGHSYAPSGCALLTVYDAAGKPTDDFVVGFESVQ